MLKIIQPYLISLVLQYFNGQIELKRVMIYAVVISVLAVIGSVLHHPYYLNTGRYGIRLRLICSTLIYRKVTFLLLLLVGVPKDFSLFQSLLGAAAQHFEA